MIYVIKNQENKNCKHYFEIYFLQKIHHYQIPPNFLLYCSILLYSSILHYPDVP